MKALLTLILMISFSSFASSSQSEDIHITDEIAQRLQPMLRVDEHTSTPRRYYGNYRQKIGALKLRRRNRACNFRIAQTRRGDSVYYTLFLNIAPRTRGRNSGPIVEWPIDPRGQFNTIDNLDELSEDKIVLRTPLPHDPLSYYLWDLDFVNGELDRISYTFMQNGNQRESHYCQIN